MSLNYYCPIRDGEVVYSVDMVRLKFHLDRKNVDGFISWWYSHDLKFPFTYDTYKSTRIGTYKLLFPCTYTSRKLKMVCNFIVGFGLIEPIHTEGENCMIEFNPNKNEMGIINMLLWLISLHVKRIDGKYFNLVRWDLAVDIPVKRSNVVLLKQGKREYHRIIGASLTEYLGKRNTNGFTKVYDKSYESNLDEEDITRIEVTCDDLFTYTLPEVMILQDIEDDFSELNSTDIVLVNLIRRLSPDEQQYQLKCLGRNKRDKLKQYIFPHEKKFEFNMNSISFVIITIVELLNCYQEYWEVED